MATRITLQLGEPGPAWARDEIVEDAMARAAKVFTSVDTTCTRFSASSPLMQMNRSPETWNAVPKMLYDAIYEAKLAYDATGGLFDPRVLRTLVSLGYASTLDFNGGDVSIEQEGEDALTPIDQAWKPEFAQATSAVLAGPEPIDLGGIGKGLAVRWASQVLKGAVDDFLIEAGGDCYCAGRSVDGGPWRIGIEGPSATAGPVAVLALSDLAVTTSSIRLRRWQVGGVPVHHLIDPRTNRPGGEDLLSVTVVADDPARAEVWSKALFISGRAEICSLAKSEGVAAAWVDKNGHLATSPAMDPHLLWWQE